MYRKGRTERYKNKAWPVIGGSLAAVIAVVAVVLVYLLFLSDKPPAEDTGKKEFANLQVVQFYLHLPDGDIIIGRKNPKFYKLLELVQKTVTSINRPEKSPLAGQGVQKAVYELQRENISLSVWLPQAQKISTEMPAEGKETGDQYHNRVLETDRILIVLGGHYRGQVFTRVPGKEEWLGWKTSAEDMRNLVELIRSGEL